MEVGGFLDYEFQGFVLIFLLSHAHLSVVVSHIRSVCVCVCVCVCIVAK